MAKSVSFGKKFMSLVLGSSEKSQRKFTIDRYVMANIHVSDEKKEFLKKYDGKVFWGDALKNFLQQRNFTLEEIEDVLHFSEKYVSRSLETPEQILWIPRALFWLFAIYSLFYWVVSPIYTSKLVDLINQELQPESPVTLFQIALGLSFTLMGFATFIWAAIGYPVQQAMVCYKFNYSLNTAKFKEQFFGPIPKRIMSLGVIPMIFAICGIIFFKEDQLLDTLAYFTLSTTYRLGMDPLKLLMLCGGLAECAAFFLGYLFPESGPPKPEVTTVVPEEQKTTSTAVHPSSPTTPEIHEPITIVTNRNFLTDEQLKQMLGTLRFNMKVDFKEN
jgi:hypothetical protein